MIEIDINDILKEIDRRLQKHPGDAPWSCVECYHGRSCVEKDILDLARERVMDIKVQITDCKKVEKYLND